MNKFFTASTLGAVLLVFTSGCLENRYGEPYGGSFAPNPVDTYHDEYYRQRCDQSDNQTLHEAVPYGGEFAPGPLDTDLDAYRDAYRAEYCRQQSCPPKKFQFPKLFSTKSQCPEGNAAQ